MISHGYPISHGWNPELPQTAISLWNLHPQNGSSMLWPSTPGAPLFALTALKAAHTISFEMLNDLAFITDSSRNRLVDKSGWTMQPLCSSRFHENHSYYGLLRPCAPHRYLHSHGVLPLELFPSHRNDRFSRSTPEPESDSRRLYAERHPASRQVSAGLHPGPTFHPGFDAIEKAHDTSSTVHSCSSFRFAPAAVLLRLLPRRSPHRLLTDAARGGLEPDPATRLRGALPHL